MSFAIQNLEDIAKDYEFFRQEESKEDKLITQFPFLDDLLGGLKPRQLYFLAARPGVGKTTLAQNIIINCCTNLKNDEYILFFSLEMSAVDVYKKFLLINEAPFLTKQAIEGVKDDTARINSAKESLNSKHILIFDNEEVESITPSFIQKTIINLRDNGIKIKALFIDYFQLLNSDLITILEYKAQEQISRQLKQIAKVNNINVFCLTQLSREYEKKDGLIPTFSDLKGSSGIEQDADVILFLYNQTKNIYSLPEEWRQLNVTVAKNRNGACDTFSVLFKPDTGVFKPTKNNAGVLYEIQR